MKYDPDVRIVECRGVYPPSEDTFLLLDCLEDVIGRDVLEMGCGAGLVACHLAKAGAIVTAADVNPRAVECARSNLERNSLPGAVIETDLFSRVEGRFDLIVFNPPYVADDVTDDISRSWAGGPTGTETLARFLHDAPSRLSGSGRIVVVLSTEMRRDALDLALSGFVRRELGSRRLLFETLSVEELRADGHGQ